MTIGWDFIYCYCILHLYLLMTMDCEIVLFDQIVLHRQKCLIYMYTLLSRKVVITCFTVSLLFSIEPTGIQANNCNVLHWSPIWNKNQSITISRPWRWFCHIIFSWKSNNHPENVTVVHRRKLKTLLTIDLWRSHGLRASAFLTPNN